MAVYEPDQDERERTLEPQILNAPRESLLGNTAAAVAAKNQMNLKIEIESDNDDGRQFSGDNQSIDQIDSECIKISDLVQQ